MPNQAIIKNIIAGNAIATKQAIYESLSEKAFDLLEIKKVDVGSDIFESTEELDEGKVDPADAHRILTQTGGVDAGHFTIRHFDVLERMRLAKEHGYVAKGDSATGRSKAYRTTLHLQNQAAKYKQNEEVEQLDELSKKTLGNYIKKATHASNYQSYLAGKEYEKGNMDGGNEKADKYLKRAKGIEKATDKLTKEDFEFINEEISDEARELILHADDDSHLYKSSHIPIVKNLEKKFRNRNI
jgi:hypothetical protein